MYSACSTEEYIFCVCQLKSVIPVILTFIFYFVKLNFFYRESFCQRNFYLRGGGSVEKTIVLEKSVVLQYESGKLGANTVI